MTSPEPSGASARLVSALRQLRERTGLSLAGLAAATAYSKSSWERYLNGKTLPPRAAVQALCRLAGEPDGRCLALWEMAGSEWGGRTKEAPSTPPAPDAGAAAAAAAAPAPGAAPAPPDPVAAPPRAHRGTAAVAGLVSVCAVVLGAVALALIVLPPRAGAPRPPASAPSPTGPLCREATCEGKEPLDTGCAGAPETLAEHRTATGATVQLRYSRVCGTSWARMWGGRIGDRIQTNAGGRTRFAQVKDRAEADTYAHTLMSVTQPGVVVQGCFLPASGGRRECFEALADHDPSGP